jgi:hypothetical protein
MLADGRRRILGGHGGQICSPNSPQGNFNETKNDRSFNETKNDRSHLLPSVREGLSSYEELGLSRTL